MESVLITMIVLPAVGAVLALLFAANATVVRWVSLVTTFATLALALLVVAKFEPSDPARLATEIMSPQMASRTTWLSFGLSGGGQANIEAYLGIDGLSLWLVTLTALLMVSSVLVSWTAITERVAAFHAWMLLLETGLLGVFCAFDLILFYVFFEFTLIPLFFLIGIWGGSERRYAAGKFFIYTLTGSLLSLVGLVALVVAMNSQNPSELTFSIPELAQQMRTQMSLGSETFNWQYVQVGVFLALFAGFAIKVPLFPFHTWLPLAHVEAPTAGSVMLAGVLLKLGTYGFLRIVLPLLPLAVVETGVPLVAALSVMGIIYGALCALGQTDMKRLIAYSSVSHLGFCMLGLFALNAEGIAGGTMQMINHGLSTGGLFLLVGMIYERLHTRQLDEMGGLASRLPLFACFLIFMSLSSMGLPGLNGFIGEVLSLIGMFKVHPLFAVLGAIGIVLGAWYLLNMLQKVLFGPKHDFSGRHGHVNDLNARELFALAPIAVMCLVIGIFPRYFLDVMKPEVDAIALIYSQTQRDGVVAAAAVELPTEGQ